MENTKKILRIMGCVLVLAGLSRIARADEVFDCHTPSSCQDMAEELVVLGVADANDNLSQLTDFMLINGANVMVVIVRDNGLLDGGATSQNLANQLNFNSSNQTYTFHNVMGDHPDQTFHQRVYQPRPGGKR